MALKHGTRLPHASGTAGVSGRAPTVRYRSGGIWPGITTGFDARCTCTWAAKDARYQVKYLNVLCIVHGGFTRPRSGQPARQIGHGITVTWHTPDLARRTAA